MNDTLRSSVLSAARPAPSSRRVMVLDAALAAGAVALAPWAASGTRASGRHLADTASLLGELLAIERFVIALYDQGLDAFPSRDFRLAGLPRTLRADLQRIREDEAVHVSSLSGLVALTAAGSTGREAPEFGMAFAGLDEFLRLLAEVENAAVGAYAGAILLLTPADAEALRLLLGVHSVEARHAAFLATMFGGFAFPTAIDPPLGRAEIAAFVPSFIGSETVAAGLSNNAETTETTVPAATATPAPATTVPEADGAVAAAIADAGLEFGVEQATIAVERVEPRDWPSSALGCDEEETVALQVITPGFLIVLSVGERRIEYHADTRGNVVRCGEA